MSPLTTYERYKQALEQIADGAPDAREIALAAIAPVKGKPTYAWRDRAEARKEGAAQRRAERSKVAREAYVAWLKAGHPPIAKWAREHGRTRSSMMRLLEQGERRMGIPHGERRLGYSWRNSNYDTVDEIFREKDPLKPPAAGQRGRLVR